MRRTNQNKREKRLRHERRRAELRKPKAARPQRQDLTASEGRVTGIGGVPVKEPTFVYAVNRLRLDGRRGRTIFTYLRPPSRPAARAAGRLRPHG